MCERRAGMCVCQQLQSTEVRWQRGIEAGRSLEYSMLDLTFNTWNKQAPDKTSATHIWHLADCFRMWLWHEACGASLHSVCVCYQ